MIIFLPACMFSASSVEAPRSIIVSERVAFESFSFLGNWSRYDRDGLFMDVVDGRFQAELALSGRFAWSSNYQEFKDTVIEVDIWWLSGDDRAMVGVICRLQANGSGYYVLVSYEGSFSIRRGGQYNDEPLREWQGHHAIPRDGSPMQMRVVCVDNYLGLYINGEYVDAAVDSRFSEGSVGLVVGLAPSAADNDIAAVQFDNLRVWNAVFE